MARCGCQGSASSTCEAIVLCVAGALGPGLMYDAQDGLIQVRRSRDAGNCVTFGSDRGLYAPCNGGGPGPGPGGGQTIDNLPEQVIAGANGGAGLIHAFASPQAIEYAVANRLDFIDCYSFTLQDQVAAWGPFTASQQIRFYTSSPSTAPARELTSDMWTQLVSDPGVPGGNPTGRNSGAREEDLEPDGGWYGFYQNPYPVMTTADALRRIGARTCVILQHAHEGSSDIQANVNAILGIQAQQWVMPSLGTTALDSVQTYIDFGIEHVCINVSANTAITAQEVVDSGATWVKIRDDQEPERIESFASSGLNVLAGYNPRQTVGEQMLELGVRGLISQDPVYQRGALGSDWYQYRSPLMTFGPALTETGLLTTETNDGDVLGTRGYSEQDEFGRFFPAEFGWQNGTPVSTNTMLLGKFCPLPSPEAYRVQMTVQVDQAQLPSGTTPKLGWLFSSDNDLDPASPIDEDASPNRHGYAGFIRVGASQTGELVIGVYDTEGAFTELAAEPTGTIAPNSWVDLELEVTNPTITLRRTNGTVGEISVDNTDWRGDYIFHLWEDVGTNGEPFYHGFRSNRLTDLGGGGVVWDQLTQTYATWEEMAQANSTWEELSNDALLTEM